MGDENENEEEVVLCEYCHEEEYYISVHSEDNSPKEILLCKRCYELDYN